MSTIESQKINEMLDKEYEKELASHIGFIIENFDEVNDIKLHGLIDALSTMSFASLYEGGITEEDKTFSTKVLEMINKEPDFSRATLSILKLTSELLFKSLIARELNIGEQTK